MAYSHKTIEYEFCTRTWSTANQNIISIKYIVLIGWYWSTSEKTSTRKFQDREARDSGFFLTKSWSKMGNFETSLYKLLLNENSLHSSVVLIQYLFHPQCKKNPESLASRSWNFLVLVFSLVCLWQGELKMTAIILTGRY
jgi:hypothetical protein